MSTRQQVKLPRAEWACPGQDEREQKLQCPVPPAAAPRCGQFWGCLGLSGGAAPGKGLQGAAGSPWGTLSVPLRQWCPACVGQAWAPGHRADAPSSCPHHHPCVHLLNICLRTYCTSRHQGTASGASILRGLQRKSTSGQVKSHSSDVIGGDGGDSSAQDTLYSLCSRHGPVCFTGMNSSCRAATL